MTPFNLESNYFLKSLNDEFLESIDSVIEFQSKFINGELDLTTVTHVQLLTMMGEVFQSVGNWLVQNPISDIKNGDLPDLINRCETLFDSDTNLPDLSINLFHLAWESELVAINFFETYCYFSQCFYRLRSEYYKMIVESGSMGTK